MLGRSLRYATFFRVLPALAVAMLVTPTVVAAQVDCGDARKVFRFGDPDTRFSSPVTSVEGLQNLMANSRQDVERLLGEAGFQGDPDDFFQAVASGDGVSRTSIEPGTRLGWIFYRKNGEPTLQRDRCWAGSQAAPAWEVQFTSQGTWYSFAVPEVCGNLSFLAQQEAPVCRVTLRDTAGDACEQTELVIDATGSTGDLEAELITPSGQTLELSDSGDGRWTVDSQEKTGTFRVVLRATEQSPRGTTIECSAEATVERDCCVAEAPSIEVTASPSTIERFESSTFTADPSVSQCTELDRVTLDGETVDSPYQITRTFEEPGSFSVTGTVRDGEGQTAEDSATVTVTECTTRDCRKQRRAWERERRRAAGGPDGDWILRGWFYRYEADEQVMFVDPPITQAYGLDNGSGLGLQAEYLFNERIGLGFGLLYSETDVQYKFDINSEWEMDTDGSTGLTLFAGPVFHLTPASRVDLFVSPFLGYTDNGDVDFTALGTRESVDFDSEFSWGGQLGLDIPFGSAADWGLHAGLTYQDQNLEAEAQDFTLEVDPLSAGVGLFFRF